MLCVLLPPQHSVSHDANDPTWPRAYAPRWGFAHPGRFATHYRRTYGFAPGTTLHT
jgi:hypothetical protein